MFEPQDTGEPIYLKLIVCAIIATLIILVLQVGQILKILKAQPKEFINQLHTELNP